MMDKPIHAIVVDDDVISLRLACAALRELGVAHPLQAEDGASALAAIRGAHEPVELALCDLEMAGMDGVELLSQLGAERPGLAVILLSAMEPALIAAVETMALSCGLRVLGTMSKPLSRERLQGYLALLHRRAGMRTVAADCTMKAEEIRLGIERRQFLPYFQPKINLHTGAIHGAEALIRWKHPDRGLISPASFIPAAEERGLIGELTWMMLDASMQTQKSWRDRGLDTTISINITVGFLEELAVTENVLALARTHGVAPRRFMLELTESMATTDMVAVIGNLVRLRMRGFGLSIDDFGTGYSSMQQLSRIPFSELKVDQSFVHGASRQPHLRTILESSLQLGKRLGLTTTAEGVETGEDLELVRSFGCDVGQGYYFAKPLEADAFFDWCRQWTAQRAGGDTGARAAAPKTARPITGTEKPADSRSAELEARIRQRAETPIASSARSA